MVVESVAGLIEALTSSDFDAVVGTPESHWVDFKRDPYPLRTAKGKWELAKDVAAIAGARGGLIVIGYATQKHENEGIEAASEHHPVPKNLVQPDQYRAILAERIYPAVRDIQTYWFPPGPHEREGVFVIEVPSQGEEDKPFVVTRVVDEEGKEQQHFVGIPIRDGDRVDWMKPETVHHQLNMGRRLQAFEALTSTRVDGVGDGDLQDEVERTVASADAEDESWLVYQSVPVSSPITHDPLALERLREVLADPPSLRAAGFNYRSASGPVWVGGSALELIGRASLRLTSSGIVTTCLPADEECLGWALSQHLPEGSPLRINPLTLVEYTLEYSRLLDLQVASSFRAQWRCRVIARGMREHQVVLEPGERRGGGIPVTPPSLDSLAQHDEWQDEFDMEGDPERDAFEALRRVYAVFGLTESAIPFTSDGRVSESIVRSQ